jgi:hypothetical protein
MFKRAWFVIAALWALAFLANGATKVNGIGEGDVMLAFAPAILGWVGWRLLRFVVLGSVRSAPAPRWKP